MDKENMVKFAKDNAIDLVFVAPDDPLADGMVDAMQEAGIRAFGPNANAAIIEASKVFSKNLMKKYGIPTAKYEVFNDAQKAIDYIKNENTAPVVVKADGLALGKGVIIAQSVDEAIEAVKEIMEDKKFGDSGNNIVIEEFLTGPEVSVLAFTDGKCVKPMVSSKTTSVLLIMTKVLTQAVWAQSARTRIIQMRLPRNVWIKSLSLQLRR